VRYQSCAEQYEQVPGFCKSAKVEEIRKNGYVLTPGRYVGAESAENDGEARRAVQGIREVGGGDSG
jgi:type I restriction enzyme M protein